MSKKGRKRKGDECDVDDTPSKAKRPRKAEVNETPVTEDDDEDPGEWYKIQEQARVKEETRVKQEVKTEAVVEDEV